MNSPKVAVTGAGSYFFARPVIWNMVNSPVLRDADFVVLTFSDRNADFRLTACRTAATSLPTCRG